MIDIIDRNLDNNVELYIYNIDMYNIVKFKINISLNNICICIQKLNKYLNIYLYLYIYIIKSKK